MIFMHFTLVHARKEPDVTTALRRFQCAACAVFSQQLSSSFATWRFGCQVVWLEQFRDHPDKAIEPSEAQKLENLRDSRDTTGNYRKLSKLTDDQD